MSIRARIQELLRLIQEEGAMGDLIQQIQEDHGFELVDEDLSGAMTDAAKRRRDGSPERAQIPVLPLTKAVVPQTSASSVDPVKLPEGITSLDQWSRTVLSAGKYAADGLSYHELATSSKQEIRSYCEKMLSWQSRQDLSAPFRDFIEFLKAYYDQRAPQHGYLPGSRIPRQLK